MKRLRFLVISVYLFQSDLVFSSTIQAQLNSTAQKGQKLLMASIPLFAIVVGYLYKRGKPEAKEKLENLIFGSLIVATAFSWSYFFK